MEDGKGLIIEFKELKKTTILLYHQEYILFKHLFNWKAVFVNKLIHSCLSFFLEKRKKIISANTKVNTINANVFQLGRKKNHRTY